jgi:elongation factor 1 alpha-like protein
MQRESQQANKSSFYLAWLFDQSESERDRGVTIDVGQTHFETPSRHVILFDAPGHKDFVANMITGAAQVRAASVCVTLVG